MTASEARAEIEVLTEHSTAPALSHDEVTLLVRKAQRADAAGRPPSDPLWEPTWNIPYAVGIGWELKAGRCVGKFDFRDANGNDFKRSQIRTHCLAQARLYKSRGAESVTLAGGWRCPTSSLQDVIGNRAEEDCGC